MVAFKVPGMTCGGCAASVRKALGKVAGVDDVQIDLTSKDVRVTGAARAEDVRTAITNAGFDVEDAASA